MQTHPTTLILASYNRPRCMRLVLTGFFAQTDLDFEMIIADDGSREETLAVVEEFKKNSPFPIRIVTQEHTIFRKTRILNRAVHESSGEQIIFCDGDCIPFFDFIQIHKSHYRPGKYAVGGYLYLTLQEARDLTPEDVRAGRHQLLLTKDWKNKFAWMHLKNRFYCLIRKRREPRILGGNFSIDRGSYYAVNGYDETFQGFGGEDTDLRNRLNRYGCRGVSIWNQAFVCHLDHQLDHNPVEAKQLRDKRNREAILANMNRTRAVKGIDKYETTISHD